LDIGYGVGKRERASLSGAVAALQTAPQHQRRAAQVTAALYATAVPALLRRRDERGDGVVDESFQLGVVLELRIAQLQRGLQEAGVDAVAEQGAVLRLLPVQAGLAEGAGEEIQALSHHARHRRLDQVVVQRLEQL